MMANLIRFNPVDDAFDDLFRGFLVRPSRAGELPETQIRMDVKEDDKAYLVQAEIPGAKKDDIQVTIDGNQVAISAEFKSEKEVKDGIKVLRSERHQGRLSRAFLLAQEVDDATAEARYQDGVLELTLPKKQAAKAKRLAIA
jgi:HSP20 family protein